MITKKNPLLLQKALEKKNEIDCAAVQKKNVIHDEEDLNELEEMLQTFQVSRTRTRRRSDAARKKNNDMLSQPTAIFLGLPKLFRSKSWMK